MLEWLKGKPKVDKVVEPPLEIGEAELKSLPTDEYYLLDLRDLAAFRTGHIKGAHLMPYMELNQRMYELPTDRLIVTVDASARRGRQAAKLIKSSGLQARNLAGGITGWTGKLVK